MSQVNWRRPLALAATLLVLSLVAFWLQYKHKPKVEADQAAEKRVFQLKDTAVESVRLVDGARKIELKCLELGSKLCKPSDHSKWEITEPKKLNADEGNANAMLSSLSNLQVSETIDLKEETPEKRAALLKEYGLDPQARGSDSTRKVIVVAPSVGQFVLYLGLTHPIGESIFAVLENVPVGQKPAGKIDDTRVFLIASNFKSHFDHDLTYWRNKKLLAVSSHEITGFALKGTKTELTATRKDGQWSLSSQKEKASGLAGDIENVDGLLSGLAYLSAKGFAAEDKSSAEARAALKGTKPVLNLTVELEKPAASKITLTFFQTPGAASDKAKKKTSTPMPKLYATVSNLDPLFEMEPTSKDRFDKGFKDLRLTKLITSMERFGVKRLEFSGKPMGAAPVVLTGTDGKWQFQSDKSEAEGGKIQDLLDKLSGNRIKDFLAGAAIPTGEQDGLIFKLGDEKSEAKRHYVFWKKDGKLYARDLTAPKKEAFTIEVTVQDALPWNKEFFKKNVQPKAPEPGPEPKK